MDNWGQAPWFLDVSCFQALRAPQFETISPLWRGCPSIRCCPPNLTFSKWDSFPLLSHLPEESVSHENVQLDLKLLRTGGLSSRQLAGLTGVTWVTCFCFPSLSRGSQKFSWNGSGSLPSRAPPVFSSVHFLYPPLWISKALLIYVFLSWLFSFTRSHLFWKHLWSLHYYNYY